MSSPTYLPSVGIICMEKKSSAKPMRSILRLVYYIIGHYAQFVIFTDEQLLREPIEAWPYVFAAIAFYSTGFPINKVMAYTRQQRVTVINGTLLLQKRLLNRGCVKDLLACHNIPQCTYAAVHRKRHACGACGAVLAELSRKVDCINGQMRCWCEFPVYYTVDEPILMQNCTECEYEDPPDFVETEYYVECGGNRIYRPFVEKPIDADDHNVYIYYVDELVKLFRKTGNKASERFQGRFPVRRDGCYIYEEFLDSGGKDLKVYAIYPNYALAEVRKAPHLDGIVERDEVTNKEKREQTILNDDERLMVNTVSMAFMQLICGLDILRTQDGISYIMDVNGFSFVKGNEFYDEQCSQSISTIIVYELYRRRRSTFRALTLFPQHEKYATDSQLLNKYIDKLNSVMHSNHYDKYLNDNILKQKGLISIFRHADRSPKFKYVFYTQNKELINIFYKSDAENARLEFRIRPEFYQERAQQIAEDLRYFLTGCSINQNTVQRRKLYEFISVPEIIYKSIYMITGSRPISEQEADGLKLIIYMISNKLAGSKIYIKETISGGAKSYKITVKWGGYLTTAGLRQSFLAGRQTKQKYIKEIKNTHINIKVFHTSERRITRTAQAVLLGFLADPEVQVEDILPILNTEPYNQSDCISPNIFDFLEQLWGDYPIPHIDYSVQQLRNFLYEDDQSLNVQSYSLKLKKYEDLRMISRLLNSESLEYKSPYQISIEKAFYTCLTDLNQQFDNEGFIHRYYFELVVSLFQRVMEYLHDDKSILLHTYITDKNETYSICMTQFISFVLLYFVQFDQFDGVWYNVSKLTDIYELLLFLIIHHNRLMKQLPDFKQLFVIAHKYNKSLARIMYGYTYFNTVQYGEKIAGNLLRSIYDDIQMSYNYYRKIDIQNLISRYHLLRFSSDYDSQMLSRRYSMANDNVAVRLAQQLTEHDGFPELPPLKDKVKKDKRQIRFYVTDDAHIYSLYYLLSNTQMQELSQFCVLSSGGLGLVNYMAQLHFIYYELFSTKYYTEEIQKIDITKPIDELLKSYDLPGPSRLVEISFSKGQSSDAWQPVTNNVLPIDSPELIYSMFPLSNINMLNTRIYRHGQFKNAYQLTTVIAVYRHGDRQPKQKLKIAVSDAAIVTQIMALFKLTPARPEDVSMSSDKNRAFLAQYLPKLQYIFLQNSSKLPTGDIANLDTFLKICLTFPPAMKFQIKFPVPYKGEKKCTLIVKYGGILTALGARYSYLAASYLVNQLQQDFATESADVGMLLKHVCVFTNDELRVKATADAFCEHFCYAFKLKRTAAEELQILCQTDYRARALMDKEKQLLNDALTLNVELCNTPVKSLSDAAQRVVRQLDAFKIEDLGNPLQRLMEIKRLMTEIANAYAQSIETHGSGERTHTPGGSGVDAATAIRIARYYAALEQFAYDSNFNVSKIGDVYDMLRYEAYQAELDTLPEEIHTKLRKAYELSRLLCKFSVPLQFGTSEFNRKIICGLIAYELIKHIIKQMEKPGIALYFVSESHIHALAKIIRIFLQQDDQIWVDFMCHLIIKIYTCGEEYRLEISFSQGSFENPFKDEFGSPRVYQPILLSDNLQGDTLENIYNYLLKITSSEAFGKRFNLGYEVIEQ